ncbi:hypothetical protein HAX54_029442 [Datura stramonium]|uniref:Uncharacterized protein n=1 Tax=Datura stramonium TaxID=4076 RepID=A0ABS8V6T3_DATST|nr:hypothetical protein [Datura stramonium]
MPSYSKKSFRLEANLQHVSISSLSRALEASAAASRKTERAQAVAAVAPSRRGPKRAAARAAQARRSVARTNLNSRTVPLKSRGRPTGEAADTRRKKKTEQQICYRRRTSADRRKSESSRCRRTKQPPSLLGLFRSRAAAQPRISRPERQQPPLSRSSSSRWKSTGRATGQIQVERAWKGSGKLVRGFRGSGSTGSQPVKVSARVTRQWVKRTSVPAVKVSPNDYLLIMESVVCSQSIPGSDNSCKWESVGTEDESGAVLAVTDVGA